ncbi:MAG: hypothetical protein JW839_23120 [Candidatus Lokiarchaeota archaeon]|nr:hypothetical protein [Candidatus Lokiarchaeota archaeon]
MKKVQIIGILDSKKVAELSAFLKKNKVNHTFWSVDDSDVKRKLLDDSRFTDKYCDFDGCMSKLPMIRLDDTGAYVDEGLFEDDVLQANVVKQIVGLE